uniref:DNA repair protein SWI5 homolog n=1 Tax=Melopsittacus undulatus TaxID=13146 RepID=A0A8C6IQ30_MELUD
MPRGSGGTAAPVGTVGLQFPACSAAAGGLQLPACPTAAAGGLQVPACPTAAAELRVPECPAVPGAAAGSSRGRAGFTESRPQPGPAAAGPAQEIPSPRPCQPNRDNNESLQYEIEELKQKDLALDQEIAQLLSEGYSLEELEKHISLLHEYNDIKDAGQMLLGKLAVIRGVTTKQLYPEYDLELSD